MTDPILLPVIAQAALTFLLMLMTLSARYKAIRDGRVKIRDIALDSSAWPGDVKKFGNCLNNQFQTPMLFYVVVILIAGAGVSHAAYLMLAWAFVGLRVVHAAIFTTTNNIPRRFYAFAAASLTLMAIWGLFAAEILQILAARN